MGLLKIFALLVVGVVAGIVALSRYFSTPEKRLAIKNRSLRFKGWFSAQWLRFKGWFSAQSTPRDLCQTAQSLLSHEFHAFVDQPPQDLLPDESYAFADEPVELVTVLPVPPVSSPASISKTRDELEPFWVGFSIFCFGPIGWLALRNHPTLGHNVTWWTISIIWLLVWAPLVIIYFVYLVAGMIVLLPITVPIALYVYKKYDRHTYREFFFRTLKPQDDIL